jgi:hypothetical protein
MLMVMGIVDFGNSIKKPQEIYSSWRILSSFT